MRHAEEHALLRTVFDSLLREHPLPWRVERDWSFEVIASDGVIIARCATNDEAETIVSLAKGRAEQKAA